MRLAIERDRDGQLRRLLGKRVQGKGAVGLPSGLDGRRAKSVLLGKGVAGRKAFELALGQAPRQDLLCNFEQAFEVRRAAFMEWNG